MLEGTYACGYLSMDGRPRPGFLSGKECCKQSDPEQSGCPSILRLLDVYGESETTSTQHRRLCLIRSSKTGETSGVCLRSQAKLITQSRALRYQIRLRSIPARASSSLSHENSLESGTESGKADEVSMKVNVSSFLISALSLAASFDICCANW